MNYQSPDSSIRHVPDSSENSSSVFEGFPSSNIKESDLDNANDFADMGEIENGMATILGDYQLNRYCLTRKIVQIYQSLSKESAELLASRPKD